MCPYTEKTCAETGCKLWIADKSMCAIALQAVCLSVNQEMMKTAMEESKARIEAMKEVK